MSAVATQQVEVIARPWRSGAVHLEVWFATFESPSGEMLTHLQGTIDRTRFVTACGKPWFGVGSASGCTDPCAITCEECREILLNAHFVARG